MFVACVAPRAWADEPARLAVRPPEGWVADPAFGPPDLAQTPQVTLAQWNAWRHGDAELVAACFRTPLRTWAPEIEPIALERIAAMTSSAALRLNGAASLHPVAIDHGARITTQSFAGDAATARTFLAFARDGAAANDPLAITACFALCASDANGSCAEEVARAELTGTVISPPPPTLGLRAILAAVHHPRTTACGALALVCLGGAVAVATRKRPRARPPA